jgi:hypothetical protein
LLISIIPPRLTPFGSPLRSQSVIYRCYQSLKRDRIVKVEISSTPEVLGGPNPL